MTATTARQTTIETAGARLYAANAPFHGKDLLKRIGCHWDGDRRQWWIGKAKREELEAVVATLNGALPEAASAAATVGLRPDAPACAVADKLREEGHDDDADKVQIAMEMPAPAEDLSRCRVYAQVEYKGRRYYVIAEARNVGRCRLTTLDGPLAFWADMADCTVVRTYEGRAKWNGRRGSASADVTVYQTLGELKSFRDRQARTQGTGRERVQCIECGSWYAMADGCGDCGGC
jgi:hypothetical protein